MKTPYLFLQDGANDCSAACLATVLHYYGSYVTPLDLLKGHTLARGGLNSADLVEIAAGYGLESRMVCLPLDQLRRIDAPCIATMKADQGGRHNVVIFSVKNDVVFYGDPASGKRRLPLAEFGLKYTGILLLLQPSETYTAKRYSRSYFYHFIQFLLPYRRRILQSLAMGLVVSGLGFGLVYLTKFFVDWALPSGVSTSISR